MPVSSAGRIVKHRKGKKGGTTTQRNHRWESFTTKIAKLSSLDPIRRVRRHDAGDSPTAAADFSYFRTSLEKWQELNLSANFISFAQDVTPLCDNLAQVVHFEKKIMELLVTYLEKGERESLEPLLELLTDFAHDLGVRFEHHYEQALRLVTSIAGTVQQDAAVIEWSFTSLTFMFKYLSKLLAPNLRPTYDAVAPLMGKRRHPPHIARFAAEAMSFLLRKAAAPALREKALPTIVKHIKQDLLSTVGTKEFSLYYHGVMTLFAEAMKGNGLTLHTTGVSLYQSLLNALRDGDFTKEQESVWRDVLYGVLTSTLHHTSSDTFKELLLTLIAHAETAIDVFIGTPDTTTLEHLLVSANILKTAVGVRKATRVADWTPLLKIVSRLATALPTNSSVVEKSVVDVSVFQSVNVTIAIVMQYAPMDALIPHISAFMETLTKHPLAKWFFAFCSYLAEADHGRFQTVALPYFQRYVIVVDFV